MALLDDVAKEIGAREVTGDKTIAKVSIVVHWHAVSCRGCDEGL